MSELQFRSPERLGPQGREAWRPRVPQRVPLHAGLWCATFLTLAFSGGVFWSGAYESLDPSIAAFGPRGLTQLVLGGAGYATAVMTILLAHEFGHYIACRRYGIPASLPFFIPGLPPIGTFGAMIRIRGRIPDRNALFDVAAAGPIAGFVPLLPLLAYGLATAEPTTMPSAVDGGGWLFGQPLAATLIEWLQDTPDGLFRPNAAYGAAWVGALVTSLNLFPVGQLDGGHALYAVSRRLHRLVSWGTLGALALFIAWQGLVERQVPGYLVWFVVLLLMRDRHPRLYDESSPLSPGRRVIALLLVLIFALCFIPVPITVVE